MVELYQSLFRHFKLKHLGSLLLANALCTVPFLLALVGPAVVAHRPALGLALLLAGFFLTGMALAATGSWLGRRFVRPSEPRRPRFRDWFAEASLFSLVMLGLFTLLTRSAPFYWSQGTLLGTFSIITLVLGVFLILCAAPYFLPARRSERLGLFAAVRRAVQEMNRNWPLTLLIFFLGVLAFAASVLTIGLFPGFAGLAALHQGAWDHAQEKNLKEA